MRKYFILLACLTFISCNKVEKACCPENPLQDSIVLAPSDEVVSDSAVIRITETLKNSEDVEHSIEGIVKSNVTLHTHNTKLIKELKTTKDSLEKVTIELRETITKIPKKRNLFQRILGVAKDSIEVIQIDTIQN